jgi:hypothetical protein
MVHHGQRLPLGLEAGDDLLGIHPGLDHLEGNNALERPHLLGPEDRAHAPFADLLQQPVGSDVRTRTFEQRLIPGCGHIGQRDIEEKTILALMLGKQSLNAAAQILIRPAGGV